MSFQLKSNSQLSTASEFDGKSSLLARSKMEIGCSEIEKALGGLPVLCLSKEFAIMKNESDSSENSPILSTISAHPPSHSKPSHRTLSTEKDFHLHLPDLLCSSVISGSTFRSATEEENPFTNVETVTNLPVVLSLSPHLHEKKMSTDRKVTGLPSLYLTNDIPTTSSSNPLNTRLDITSSYNTSSASSITSHSVESSQLVSNVQLGRPPLATQIGRETNVPDSIESSKSVEGNLRLDNVRSTPTLRHDHHSILENLQKSARLLDLDTICKSEKVSTTMASHLEFMKSIINTPLPTPFFIGQSYKPSGFFVELAQTMSDSNGALSYQLSSSDRIEHSLSLEN